MRQRTDIRIEVEELIIIESGTYPEQFLRPYRTEVTGSLLDRIEERFAKQRKFTPALLANIASQFMVPDNKHRGVIDIPHGWSTRRGRFILTLNLNMGTGDVIKQMVLGYTNSVGFTTKHVDHDMEFYINNTFMLAERAVRTQHGWKTMYVPAHNNDVLSDRDNDGLRRNAPEIYTMRPEDIYSSIDASATTELVDDLTDMRTTLSRNAIKSKSSNRLASRYMARVLDGRQKAMSNNEYGNAAVDINAEAHGYVQESYASDDVFLRKISNIQGTTMTVDNFTFDDLLRIDPEAERRTETKLLNTDARSGTEYHADSKNLGGAEEEDQVAAMIAIAIPALMLETGLHQVTFQAHNQGREEEFEFVPAHMGTFIRDADPVPFAEAFEQRVIDEVLVPLTLNNQVDIGLNLHCRAFGEIDFTLFFDGKNHGRYVFPTFTNALASPIITTDREDVRNVTKGFTGLFDHFLPSDGIAIDDGSGSGGGGRFSF